MNGSIVDRVIGAARLDPATYDEIKADETATSQALLVVILAAVSAAIGSALGILVLVNSGAFGGLTAGPDTAIAGAVLGTLFVVMLILGFILSIVGWFVYSALAYWIGTNFFEGRGQATFPQVLRVVGFAHGPRLLSVLSFIPVLGGLISFALTIWVAVTTVVAIRQTMRLTTTNAIITVVIAVVVYFILTAVVTAIVVGSLIAALVLGAAAAT